MSKKNRNHIPKQKTKEELSAIYWQLAAQAGDIPVQVGALEAKLADLQQKMKVVLHNINNAKSSMDEETAAKAQADAQAHADGLIDNADQLVKDAAAEAGVAVTDEQVTEALVQAGEEFDAAQESHADSAGSGA